MTLEDIDNFVGSYMEKSEKNYVSQLDAIRPDLVSMQIFERSLIGIASPDDTYFTLCKEPHVIGPHFMTPNEWLSNAKSVISIFFSYTGRVIKSNIAKSDLPSDEWLHARYERQAFIRSAMLELKDKLEREGHRAIVPLTDPRFESVKRIEKGKCTGRAYTSNWSERHVGFACGLGTFGLSTSLITKYGAAGRLGSLLTTLKLPPSERSYTGVYEYCNMCGACLKRCPVNAISSISEGKDHDICSTLINETKVKFPPRLGCGKCQTGVPCQNKIPNT